ncbi:VOC family protein [Streptomyces sp. NPDC005408]|uniref:VOC family protein n=1 Tax=Streptomyces sp. NPDC005408 TaxID=3155341 RepID=UPI00339DFC22
MELTLEVIMIPVTDLDRSKKFYEEGCGFNVDLDQEVAPGIRIIQMTPPGSRCSVSMGSGLPDRPGQTPMAPGSLHGLQLCVTDIAATRAAFVERSVDVSEIQHVGERGWEDGPGQTWNSFLFFQDPDGNGWVIQEAPAPLSDR